MRLELVPPLHKNIPGDGTSLMLWVWKLTLWIHPKWYTPRFEIWRNGIYWGGIGFFGFRWGMNCPSHKEEFPGTPCGGDNFAQPSGNPGEVGQGTSVLNPQKEKAK